MTESSQSDVRFYCAHRSNVDGMTMIEVLIVLVVMGVLFAAVTAALTLTTRQVHRNTASLTRANDSQFVVTYMSRDLASAASKTLDPAAQPIEGLVLPGTNVLQIDWTESFGGPTPNDRARTLVAYRYSKTGAIWGLERREYRAAKLTDPLTLHHAQVLATSLADPPPGWVDGAAPPTHALALQLEQVATTGRSAVNMTMTMSNGQEVKGGGQNQSDGPVAPRPAGEQWIAPTSAQGRCSGRIAMILDTSGSVPQAGGGAQLEQAAAGFVDGLADMSATMTIIGFDRSAYQMYPGTASDFGQYFSLNDPIARQGARDRILLLDDQDGTYDFRDSPTTDGIHWQQTANPTVDPVTGETYFYEGGTNWEDGLWHALRDGVGNELTGSQLPTLAVLITDGQPNQIRPAVQGGTDAATAVSRAKVAADALEGRGVEVIGIGVGNAFTDNPEALPNLANVVGPIAWTGESPGNAVDADYYIGKFSELGQILNTITSTRCISAAALRPIDAAGKPSKGAWTMSAEPGTFTSDSAVDPLVQLAFPMVGTPRRWVDVWVTSPAAGRSVASVECRSGGVLLDGTRVELQPGATPDQSHVRLNVAVNESMSCVIVEKP